MKKVLYLFCALLVGGLLVGCTAKEKNIEGTLPEIMEKLYDGVPEEQMPMMVDNIELNGENFKNYAFADIKYKEAIASEAMTGATPHSVDTDDQIQFFIFFIELTSDSIIEHTRKQQKK